MDDSADMIFQLHYLHLDIKKLTRAKFLTFMLALLCLYFIRYILVGKFVIIIIIIFLNIYQRMFDL